MKKHFKAIRLIKCPLISICMILFITTAAYAILGFSWLFWGTLNWEALLKGVPSSADGVAKLEVTLREVQVNCDNPASNAPTANATIHLDQDATVAAYTYSTDWMMLKGGKVAIEGEPITNQQILDATGLYSGDLCPNSNWELKLTSVRDFDATVTLNLDDSTAWVYHFVGCDFGENPQPGDEPVCDDTWSETFDWK